MTFSTNQITGIGNVFISKQSIDRNPQKVIFLQIFFGSNNNLPNDFNSQTINLIVKKCRCFSGYNSKNWIHFYAIQEAC